MMPYPVLFAINASVAVVAAVFHLYYTATAIRNRLLASMAPLLAVGWLTVALNIVLACWWYVRAGW